MATKSIISRNVVWWPRSTIRQRTRRDSTGWKLPVSGRKRGEAHLIGRKSNLPGRKNNLSGGKIIILITGLFNIVILIDPKLTLATCIMEELSSASEGENGAGRTNILSSIVSLSETMCQRALELQENSSRGGVHCIMVGSN